MSDETMVAVAIDGAVLKTMRQAVFDGLKTTAADHPSVSAPQLVGALLYAVGVGMGVMGVPLRTELPIEVELNAFAAGYREGASQPRPRKARH